MPSWMTPPLSSGRARSSSGRASALATSSGVGACSDDEVPGKSIDSVGSGGNEIKASVSGSMPNIRAKNERKGMDEHASACASAAAAASDGTADVIVNVESAELDGDMLFARNEARSGRCTARCGGQGCRGAGTTCHGVGRAGGVSTRDHEPSDNSESSAKGSPEDRNVKEGVLHEAEVGVLGEAEGWPEGGFGKMRIVRESEAVSKCSRSWFSSTTSSVGSGGYRWYGV